jgi:polysaccharide lyase-like protein
VSWRVSIPVASLLVAAAVACDGNMPSVGPSAGAGPAADRLFADDFESGTLDAWQDGINPALHRVVSSQAGAQSGSRYLAVTFPPGRDGGWLTRFLMPGGDTLYASYYLRLSQGWQGGTKLIAFYGSRTDDQWSGLGQAGLCPNGNDFFAAMLIAEANGNPGATRFYTYYPAMRREPDGVTCWGRFGDGSETYLEPLTLSTNVWHRIELEVRLNTPGQADGRQAFWIDGAQRGRWSGLSFRQTAALRLNAVQLTFSVTGGVPQPQEIDIDNVTVLSARP